MCSLVDHRGLADSRIAGHEHEFRRAVRYDPVERSEQSVDLALPAIELLRDQQPVRYVATAEREGFDPAMRLPLLQAVPEIGLDTRGGLVARLGSLGEEFHHNSRERPRDARDPLAGRRRLPRDMAVHPLHRIGGGEGELSPSTFRRR